MSFGLSRRKSTRDTRLFFEAADVERLQLDDLAARTPLGLGAPDDVAAAAVYLASPAAKWVTGQTIQVSGGITIV
jgi:NAD(P)-dependent dehydrogenase (short-subunit alcohol dehydrogenase family)